MKLNANDATAVRLLTGYLGRRKVRARDKTKDKIQKEGSQEGISIATCKLLPVK